MANTKSNKKGSTAKLPGNERSAPKPSTRLHADVEDVAARYPALGAVDKAAFGRLCADAKADDLGGRTRAPAVRDGAARWMVTMDEALARYPGALVGYAQARFSYFLVTLARLATAIEIDKGRLVAVSGAKGGAEGERQAASDARTGAIERLTTYAGGRGPELERLATAAGHTDTDDMLANALRSLAELELAWLKSTDPEEKVLVAAAGLSATSAAEVAAAADRLDEAQSGARKAGPARGNDSPDVNRVEGQMLFEMREARRLFAAAKRKNRVVPTLVPPPALRSAFGLSKSGKAAAEEPAGPLPANPA